MKNIIISTLLFIPALSWAQEVNIRFNRNVELFGYVIEMGEPSDNDPNHPVSKIINQWPMDRELPSLAVLYEEGENLDYSSIIGLMYNLPSFPTNIQDPKVREVVRQLGFQSSEDQQYILSLLSHFNEFAQASHFDEVWNDLATSREDVHSILQARKPSASFMSAIESFYDASFDSYEIIPSLTVWSGPGWGVKDAAKNSAVFVLGPLEKNYDFTAERFTNLIIHEFGHSFVNHHVVAQKELIKDTEPLYEQLRTSMTRQGYRSWLSTVIEHYVRAGEVIISVQIGEGTLSQSIRENYIVERDFIYLDEIVSGLENYRLKQGHSYREAVKKTLEDFTKKHTRQTKQIIPRVSGTVTDKSTGQPIPFAHVGIRGKNMGTISRLDGSFQIDLQRATAGDSLVFSSIGYQTISFAVEQIDQLLDVSLEESILQLEEVVVSRKRKKQEIEKFGRVKPSKTTRGQNGSLEFGFGGEQGVKIAHQRDYYLDKVGFHMRFNTVDSILFRINIYSSDEGMPGESLLNKNLFVTSKKGQKWITKDIKEQILLIKEDIIVSYEVVQIWYSETSANNIYFTFGKDYPEGGVYLRRSSMDNWTLTEPEAFPITLYVEGRIY